MFVEGFPASYTPGQAYHIEVKHNGGELIRQFNGSCRVGTGSANAGVITVDNNTALYNVPGETNGVHLATATSDRGAFFWAAPASGTGTVKLYIAGLQGTSAGGSNTTLVLTSTEVVGVEDGGPGARVPPARLGLTLLGPNPGIGGLTVGTQIASPIPSSLAIFDFSGRLVRSYLLPSGGPATLSWDGRDSVGRLAPQGMYIIRLRQGERTTTVRGLLLR
jgi:hypothetical protein